MPTLRQTFESQLVELQHSLVRMGSDVEEMLDSAMRALTLQDLGLAERVIEMDDRVDQMDIEIETACMRLLALQQPMSYDLRIIGTAMKIITDLERIADYAVDIAKTMRRLAEEPYLTLLTHLPRMGETTRRMVHTALQAYVERDLKLVDRVVRDDDLVDALEDQLFTELLQTMQQDAGLARRATLLLFIGRYLERCADHAVNVAERVHYMETGVLTQLAASHKQDQKQALE
jgi:phosphate transport system protein